MLEVLRSIGSVASAIITLTTCITLLIKPIRNKMLGASLQAEGIKCLLRNEITNFYYKHKTSCEIKQYEWENLERIYNAYKKLNGNSFVDRIMKEIKELWMIV